MNKKHEAAWEKTKVLIEAMPYFRQFHGKTVVIKYGGNAMLNEDLKKDVINDIVLMQLVSMRPVLVHGGGPEINGLLKKLAIQSSFVNGLRVTDAATMEVVEMALVGKVNPSIVNHINQANGKALGLSGKDGNLLVAHQKYAIITDEKGKTTQVDIGQVGEIEKVNTELLNSLLEQGYIPVISPIGVGTDGKSYNINADTAAGKVAGALKAEKLILLTDVEGIYRDYQDKESLISLLHKKEAEELIKKGVIDGGMIPKVECCLQALAEGVVSTHILDGRLPHSLLLEIFTKEGIGTMVAE